MEILFDGVDISENNKVTDWSMVPGEVAAVRASQGGWFSDKDYLFNISRVRAAGKRYIGHYMVVEPLVDTVKGQKQTAENQAQRFINVVGDPGQHDFAVVDWESPRKLVPPPPVSDVLEVATAIEDMGHWGGRLMWYTFYSLAKNNVGAFGSRPLWLSTLGNTYEVGYRWCQELGATLWQYDQDTVSGCRTSPIDQNMILNRDIMDAISGLTVTVPTQPEEEQMYFQIIGDGGGTYTFGPNGYVFMGNSPTVHSKLNETGMAKVIATDVPQAELDAFATAWKAGMSG